MIALLPDTSYKITVKIGKSQNTLARVKKVWQTLLPFRGNRVAMVRELYSEWADIHSWLKIDHIFLANSSGYRVPSPEKRRYSVLGQRSCEILLPYEAISLPAALSYPC